MREMIVIAIAFISFIGVHAQDIPDNPIPVEEIIYKDSVVNKHPEFPGGIENCYKYIAKKFTAPNASGLVDKVALTFIVEKDGSFTDMRIVHDAGFGTGDQMQAIIENGPKWQPGTKDGKIVRVFYRLPIPILTEE